MINTFISTEFYTHDDGRIATGEEWIESDVECGGDQAFKALLQVLTPTKTVAEKKRKEDKADDGKNILRLAGLEVTEDALEILEEMACGLAGDFGTKAKDQVSFAAYKLGITYEQLEAARFPNTTEKK